VNSEAVTPVLSVDTRLSAPVFSGYRFTTNFRKVVSPRLRVRTRSNRGGASRRDTWSAVPHVGTPSTEPVFRTGS
jgi:hypothetical protein